MNCSANLRAPRALSMNLCICEMSEPLPRNRRTLIYNKSLTLYLDHTNSLATFYAAGLFPSTNHTFIYVCTPSFAHSANALSANPSASSCVIPNSLVNGANP